MSSPDSQSFSYSITFADPYNSLSAQSQDSGIAAENDTRRTTTLSAYGTGLEAIQGWGQGFADLERRVAALYSSLVIEAGNRLHIRLGWGSDASQLPIVFNGTVSSVKRNQDYIEVVALGDGAELTNKLQPAAGDDDFYNDTAAMGQGWEVRNIIMSFFTAGAPSLTTWLEAGLGSAINPYGIQHFGNVSTFLVDVDTGEAGVNVYSGWQDNPVNVTYASEDGFMGPVAQAVAGVFDLIGDGVNAANAADQQASKDYLKGYGKGGKSFAQDLEANEGWRMMSGDELVGIRMENATPWDVISTLRYVEPEYIRTVVPFGLRSTLFYGKPYWPFHYDYDYQAIEDWKSSNATTAPVNSTWWQKEFQGGMACQNVQWSSVCSDIRNIGGLSVHQGTRF